MSAGGSRSGAPYGIPTLDRMTLGMKPGELIIAAGRPGMGKTTFATAIATQTAMHGAGVYFVSLEMVAQELAERTLAALCFDDPGDVISYRRISEANSLSDVEFARLRKARDRLDGLPLDVEQEAGLMVSQIAARARRRKAQLESAGKRLRLVVVDHLGIVKPSKRYAGARVHEVSELTAAFKALAKELGVAVMLLCQLSRGVEHRDDKRPALSDLRDSGSIEQDADLVLGLYRPAYYLERKSPLTDGETEILIGSQNELVVEILKNNGRAPPAACCRCSVRSPVPSWRSAAHEHHRHCRGAHAGCRNACRRHCGCRRRNGG